MTEMEYRRVLEDMPAMHLRCERKEDWDTMMQGLLHDERQRFTPEPKEIIDNEGYRDPMVLGVYGQLIYVYPPRNKT